MSSSNIKIGDVYHIDFPEEFVEDQNRSDDIPKYCVTFVPDFYKEFDNWNEGTIMVALATTKEYRTDNATNVCIDPGEYSFFNKRTFIICSKLYPIPMQVVNNGEFKGELRDEHIEDLRLAGGIGLGIFGEDFFE